MKKFKKNIMVVLGGTSRERQVSLSSGKACLKAIRRLGFNVKTFDPQKKNFEQINDLVDSFNQFVIKKNIDYINKVTLV